MTNKRNIVMVILGFALSLWGCQASQGSKTYTPGQAQTPLTVYYGTVLKVSEVTIQSQQTGAGAVGGAIVGGVIGSTVGSGRGRKLATTAGSLGGAAAGSAMEDAASKKPALEIEVEMDDGRVLLVVQEKDDEFAVGDRIRLVKSPDGVYRIRQ